MKISFILSLLCLSAFSNNVLLIGDSHTAGIYGVKLHEYLSKEFDNVVTYGHSSSAAIHWLSDKDILLSGGKYNALSINKEQILDPKPVHWRVKTLVPHFMPLLENMTSLHSQWTEKIPYRLVPDLVIIGLGANDANSIADTNGVIRKIEYTKRMKSIKEMITLVKSSGASCIWIGPPNGAKKSKKNQDLLYHFLRESVAADCPFFSSNHYNVNGCDGIHFNCSALRSKGIAWAKEVFEFILKNRQD